MQTDDPPTPPVAVVGMGVGVGLDAMRAFSDISSVSLDEMFDLFCNFSGWHLRFYCSSSLWHVGFSCIPLNEIWDFLALLLVKYAMAQGKSWKAGKSEEICGSYEKVGKARKSYEKLAGRGGAWGPGPGIIYAHMHSRFSYCQHLPPPLLIAHNCSVGSAQRNENKIHIKLALYAPRCASPHKIHTGNSMTGEQEINLLHDFHGFLLYLFGFKSPEGDLKPNISVGG